VNAFPLGMVAAEELRFNPKQPCDCLCLIIEIVRGARMVTALQHSLPNSLRKRPIHAFAVFQKLHLGYRSWKESAISLPRKPS
jgi:hypothetical protein